MYEDIAMWDLYKALCEELNKEHLTNVHLLDKREKWLLFNHLVRKMSVKDLAIDQLMKEASLKKRLRLILSKIK